MRSWPVLLCSVFLTPFVARAENVTSLLRAAAAEIRHQGAPGVALAVVAGGRTYFWNSGSSERPGLAVTNRTLFETASISKVFTTTLLGIDVARGDKALRDPVQKYLPGYTLRPRMQRATLEMLGTFTAGLPEVPGDYRNLPGRLRGIRHYPVPRFLRFISRFEPARRLPAPRAYGDTSVGLLGLCLGNLRLDTWERRLRAEIFDPLGMPDTALRLTRGQEQRLARGREDDGRPADRWKIDAFAPADGIKSTTADLAQFLRGVLGENEGAPADLEEGMDIAVRTGFFFPVGGTRRFQGLAWRSDPVPIGGRNYWIVTKSGGVPGFSSKISFSRELGIGVAVLTNVSHLDLTDVEFELIKRLALAR